jgi:hypothetical protein
LNTSSSILYSLRDDLIYEKFATYFLRVSEEKGAEAVSIIVGDIKREVARKLML